MKKTASVLLAALLSAALCANVYAFVPQKIKSLRGDFASRLWDIRLDGETMDASNLTQIEAHPSSELEIALTGRDVNADLFLDQNGAPINTADVTMSKMRATNVAAEANVVSGKNVFAEVELTVRNAGTPAARPVVRLRFSDKCADLDLVDFSATLCISIGGVEQDGSKLELAGTFGNFETEVHSGDMSVSANSAVLFATEDIPLISIDAGAGVAVDASLRAGKRYLVTAARSSDAYDLAMIEESNGVVDVIALNTVGFESGQILGVRIESGQVLQVYGENGDLLGNTSQTLPYSGKYYLTNKAVSF